MLTIYLHRSQRGLLEELRAVCPDLYPASRSLSPAHATYHSYLDEQDQGRSQKRWLAEHLVLFVDTERQRERRVRDFLRAVVLDPNGEEALISFARVEDDPGVHRVHACTRRQELSFYLLANWTGRELMPFFRPIEGLYVSQAEGQWVVSSFDARGCLDRVVYRAHTEAEIEHWLLQHRYVQIYALSTQPGVCGLYRYLREDGLAELWLGDE